MTANSRKQQLLIKPASVRRRRDGALQRKGTALPFGEINSAAYMDVNPTQAHSETSRNLSGSKSGASGRHAMLEPTPTLLRAQSAQVEPHLQPSLPPGSLSSLYPHPPRSFCHDNGASNKGEKVHINKRVFNSFLCEPPMVSPEEDG